MCGIAGFIYSNSNKNATVLTNEIKAMTTAIAYRGPDAEGHWVDETHGIALGHRRLAIVDISEAGCQPMVSSNQRFVLVYNGEIYNAPALKEILQRQGHSFKGHSDTEILLAAFCTWGITDALKKMVGMFAFAVWDRQEKTVWLGRDRLGKKPLYYGWQGKTFFFCSDLNALRASSAASSLTIDRSAIASFHHWAFIPSPHSLYQGIQKLKPGTVRSLTMADIHQQTTGTEQSFWDFNDVFQQGISQRSKVSLSFDQAIDETEHLLRQAVNDRLLADVSIGGFLSGGIDSALVTAFMQQQATRPVQTFSVGFLENGYDESGYAEKVARHLGTEHHTEQMTPQGALTLIQDLPQVYDEPFADSSQLPTLLVARLAAQSVKVVLSGDGGDEVFGGYTRYLMSNTVYKIFDYLPFQMRLRIATLLKCIPACIWGAVEPIVPIKHLETKIAKGIELLREPQFEDVYTRLLKRWNHQTVFKNHAPYASSVNTNNFANKQTTPIDWMQYHDTLHYLVDDILVKVDRATMSVGLEARCPFLDHRLLEYAWKLPVSYKINQGKGKLLLRSILGKYVPKELFERPKMGFGIPINEWLRGPLKEWANSLLTKDVLEDRGYDSALIQQRWTDHCEKEINAGDDLWMVLMAQLWENHLSPKNL